MEELTADRVIDLLDLQPHPEGGHFREIWRDSPPDGARGHASSILYLLRRGEASRRHRLDATEIWHFHAGSPLELVVEDPGMPVARHMLAATLVDGGLPQVVVPPGAWQSARALGPWTLVGCTVAPAFTFDGFELADEPPD